MPSVGVPSSMTRKERHDRVAARDGPCRERRRSVPTWAIRARQKGGGVPVEGRRRLKSANWGGRPKPDRCRRLEEAGAAHGDEQRVEHQRLDEGEAEDERE